MRYVIVLGALALAACRPAPSPTIIVDPALAPLIPADTTILTGIRVEELKKTSLYRTLRSSGKLVALDRFEERTGIDLDKKVFDILLASNTKTAIALARVQFVTEGTAGVEPPLGPAGARKFQYKGYTLYGDENAAGTYFNRSVVVAGPTDAVRAVIDARDGSKGGPPKELLDRVNRISSKNQLWAVSSAGWQGSLPAGISGPLSGLKNMPIDIRSITATADVSNGVKAAVEVLSGDQASTTKMHDAIRGMIGLGRLTTPNDRPELLRFYDAIEVTKRETAVDVRADVPMDLVEQFLKLLGDRNLI